MTPFAQLGEMEKRAYNGGHFPFAPSYLPGRMPSSAMQPPAAAGVNAAANASQGGGWGRAAGGLALDVGLGWNPITGVPWFGGKAVRDFSQGNWGSGIMHVGLGALSFLPGGGSIGAAAKGGGRLATMAPRLAQGWDKAKNFMRPFQTGSKVQGGVRKGLQGVGWGGVAAGAGAMMAGQGSPESQPGVIGGNQQPGYSDYITDSSNYIRDQGYSTT